MIGGHQQLHLIPLITYPAGQIQAIGQALEPGAEPHALHPPTDDDVDGAPHQNVAPICQGTNSLSP